MVPMGSHHTPWRWTYLYSSFCLRARTRKAVKMAMATTKTTNSTPTVTPTLLTRKLQALSWYQNPDCSEHLVGMSRW